MKKSLYLFIAIFGISSSAQAGVTFLPQASASVGNYSNRSTVSSDQKCKNEGYSYSSCANNTYGVEACPHNSSYFRYCCDKSYKFTKEECRRNGLSYSSSSCGGLYKCL